MPLSELSQQQQAFISSRARVWEVRRFCQVLPSVAKYVRGADTNFISTPLRPHERFSANEPDGALAALLRCLVHRTGSDLAMVSLLDDHTQYFVSGASRSNMNDIKVTLDSTKWYGCESVSHHGGLCERTITLQNRPGNMALYEELDMTKVERTKNLPFVQGEVAKFRYYAGVPLNPYDGPNIGTLFIFSEQPSEQGLCATGRAFMFETASHITRYLEQAVEALESKRVLRFNKSVASLLDAESYTRVAIDAGGGQPLDAHHKEPLVSNLYTEPILRLYHLATTLLHDTFDFDGVRIQEVDQSGSHVNNNPDWNGSKVLAQHIEPMEQEPGNPSPALTERLLEMFPQGCIMQRLEGSDDIVAATSPTNVVFVVDVLISTELPQVFPKAQQIIVMPLWDTHRERNIGVVLGFANNQARIYLSSTDLLSISVFCTTLMTQVRRLEVQAMDRIKADFLGSMSHEMRTPLHGILSALELLADTPYSTDQRDLLETARYSGVLLLDTIERVLHFSKISSTTRVLDETRSNGSSVRTTQQSSPLFAPIGATPHKRQTSKMIEVCEDVLQGEARRLRLKESMQSQLSSHGQRAQSRPSSPTPSAFSAGPNRHPVVLFDTNVASSCTLVALASFRAVFTHLLNNAVKFSAPTGCVRVSLDVDETSCTLVFTDAGKGISPNFLRYSIFDAFSQEDPLVEGTGLGLSIVKRTVTALGGHITVDSNEARGSTFTTIYPSKRVVFDPSHVVQLGVDHLPMLQMSLFTPSRWETEGGMRGRRSAEMLSESLTRGIGRWFRPIMTPWEAANMDLRLLIVLEEDLEDAKRRFGETFDRTKCLVLCPDFQTTPSTLENMTTIVGPVTLSSIQNGLSYLFPDLVATPDGHQDDDQLGVLMEEPGEATPGRGRRKEKANGIALVDGLAQATSRLAIERTFQESGTMDAMLSEAISTDELKHSLDGTVTGTNTKALVNNVGNGEPMKQQPETRPPLLPKLVTKDPKLLLVDDNPVNLKVLNMYARKCSSTAATSVDGGQKAIDAFKEAFFAGEDSKGSQRFDLIFLDLSMPEVSGFDVARQIREIEAKCQCQARVYICALTGLSSDKDRNAAYASGVDQYLVKPARLKDLQWAVGRWRDSLASE